eukprot:Em0012g1074a
MVLTLWQLWRRICEEHVRCACHTLQLSIKNHIDPPKPTNEPAPTNATSELIATFHKLGNKIHASPLLTENLRTAQSGGPAAELIVEILDQEDDVNEAEGANYAAAAANTINHHLHGSPRGHTLKRIQDVATQWNLTFYMLSQCVHLTRPLCKLVDELGLEGPSENDWSTAELLCHFMKPFQTVTDYLQDPTLGSLSRKLTQLILYLSKPKPPQSWGLNKAWVDLPIAVSYMRDFLLTDLTKRWDMGNVLLGMAANVDPRHKSLEWLKRHQQHTIQKQLLKEMFAVAGASG